MNKTIVVLSASSGGGHNAAANAIVNRIKARYGDQYDYKIVDIYRDKIVSRLPGLAMIRYQSDFVWQLFLRLTNNRLAVRIIALFMQPYMLRQIVRELPDSTSHLIAVHFNPAQILRALAKRFSSPPQTSIVVTDFDPHWAWLGKDTDQLFVVSDSGVRRARSIGYQDCALMKMPLVPVDEIQHRSARQDIRGTLKLLLISGQEGSNGRQIIRLIRLIDSLGEGKGITLTVVCGYNRKLKSTVSSLRGDVRFIDLEVKGYVEKVAQTFHQYDLMLVRTSPGVLSECITAGVPVLGFDWTAHEVYQTTYITENGLGTASRKSSAHAEFLQRVFNDSEFLGQLYRNVEAVRESVDYTGFVQRLVHGAK